HQYPRLLFSDDTDIFAFYLLSLPDALPILFAFLMLGERISRMTTVGLVIAFAGVAWMTLDPHALNDWKAILVGALGASAWALTTDRKSTRLNSSHVKISYAVFCLKKKKEHD